MNRSLFQIVLLAALTAIALSCSCFPESFETRFCASNLAARVLILSESDNCNPGSCDPIADQANGRKYYSAFVLQRYRGSSFPFIVLSTAVNSALCGVNLVVGQQYFIAVGALQSGFPFSTYPIGLCNIIIPWNSMTPAQLSFIQNPDC